MTGVVGVDNGVGPLSVSASVNASQMGDKRRRPILQGTRDTERRQSGAPREGESRGENGERESGKPIRGGRRARNSVIVENVERLFVTRASGLVAAVLEMEVDCSVVRANEGVMEIVRWLRARSRLACKCLPRLFERC